MSLFMAVFSLFGVRKEVKKKDAEGKKLKVREKKSTAKRQWKETVSYDCVS